MSTESAKKQGRAGVLDYIKLHLNILLFSFTTVFSKAASVQLNEYGVHSRLLYVFAFLMLLNCGIYALAWQQVIKKFQLSIAYANKSVSDLGAAVGCGDFWRTFDLWEYPGTDFFFFFCDGGVL